MKKINYEQRSNFYDLEVTSEKEIVTFLTRISKQLKVKRIINCPCASGIYIKNFAKLYQYSYFVDIDNAMIEKVNEKKEKYNLSNIEALKLDIKELNKLNELADCIIMLNQGLQYIETKDFKSLLNKLEVDYLILDLFDFRKKGNLTYFKSNILEDNYYLTREFKLNDKHLKRYNKFKWDKTKINFKYKYYINNVCKYTTEFQLYNYPFDSVSNIINKSKYKIYKVYGDYNFIEYKKQKGHYILILRRCKCEF